MTGEHHVAVPFASRPELAWQRERLSRETVTPFVSAESDAPADADCDLTLAVVAYREGAELIELLATLASANDPHTRVLLVDNGLDAQVAARAREVTFAGGPLHYIQTSANLGCAHGRNVAIAVATTPWIAFLDADAAVGGHILADFRDAIADFPDAVAIRGRVVPLRTGTYVPAQYDLGAEPRTAVPAAEGVSAWRVDAIAAAGGFEPSLYGGEGRVLCHRLIEIHGAAPDTFRYDPRVVLRHDYVDDDAHLAEKLFRNRLNSWMIERRYPLLADSLRRVKRTAPAPAASPNRPSPSPSHRKADAAVRRRLAEGAESYFSQRAESWRERVDATHPSGDGATCVLIDHTGDETALAESLTSVARQSAEGVAAIVTARAVHAPGARDAARAAGPAVDVVEVGDDAPHTWAAGARVAIERGFSTITAITAGDTLAPTVIEESANILADQPAVGAVVWQATVAPGRSQLDTPPDRCDAQALRRHAPIGPQLVARSAHWESAHPADGPQLPTAVAQSALASGQQVRTARATRASAPASAGAFSAPSARLPANLRARAMRVGLIALRLRARLAARRALGVVLARYRD